MSADDDLKSTITSLGLWSVIGRADRNTVLRAIELIGLKAGVETIDGLSISDWFERERVLALEHELVSIEDDDPAMAAMLQEHLDNLKKKGGLSDPE